MARDLEQAGKDLVCGMALEARWLDIGTMRDDLFDRAYEAADSAVIYNSEAAEIINEYETHPAATNAADDADGSEVVKPSEWQRA